MKMCMDTLIASQMDINWTESVISDGPTLTVPELY